MGAEPLVMLDEGEQSKEQATYIPIVLSNNCEIENNILRIPKDEVLFMAANMITQAALSG